ncbi:MAG: radical SAM protein [archaeon]
MPDVVLLNLSPYRPLSTKVLARSLVKAGVSCSVLDFSDLERKTVSPNLAKGTYAPSKFGEFVEKVKKEIDKESKELSKVKFIGISFYDWELEKHITFPISHYLKKNFPSALLVGGGPAFNTNPKGFFSAARLDYAIAGEGEKAFPALVKAIMSGDKKRIGEVEGVLMRKGGRIVLPAKKAMLTREEIENSPITFAKEASGRVVTYTERGCANACVFCSVPRKGKPVALKDETIIEGIKELSDLKYIKEIHFADDQLFFDKERTMRLFNKIIALGLNKRFKFSGLATVDSFLKNGQVDVEFIRFLKRANFSQLSVGTEALNDAMLKELKGGRFTAILAMKVNEALRSAGISTAHFMLAGGIETRGKDFLESYYRGLVRGMKHRSDYFQPAIVQAFRTSAYFDKAKKEGALFTQHGKPFKGTGNRSTTAAFVVPKDPALREVFLKALRNGKKSFNQYDVETMVDLSKKLDALGQNSPGMTRRLQKQLGVELSHDDRAANLWHNFFFLAIKREIKNKGLPQNSKGYTMLMADEAMKQRLMQEAKYSAKKYSQERQRAEKLKGISRLRQIAKMRNKFGVGMELPDRYRAIRRK